MAPFTVISVTIYMYIGSVYIFGNMCPQVHYYFMKLRFVEKQHLTINFCLMDRYHQIFCQKMCSVTVICSRGFIQTGAGSCNTYEYLSVLSVVWENTTSEFDTKYTQFFSFMTVIFYLDCLIDRGASTRSSQPTDREFEFRMKHVCIRMQDLYGCLYN